MRKFILLSFLFTGLSMHSSNATPKNAIVDDETGAMVNFGDESSFGSSLDINGKWNPKDPKKGFTEVNSEGVYLYSKAESDGSKVITPAKEWKPNNENFAKGFIKMDSSGAYIYKAHESPKGNSGSFRLGSMSPPQIQGDHDLTFKTFYSDKNLSVVLYDYEYQNLFGLSNLSFVAGTGLATVTGSGRFASDTTIEAKEKYSFYLFPNHLSLGYRFQYVSHQWIAPYISAGFMPMGFVEYRDDNEDTTIGKALAIQTTGGLKINMNAFDEAAAARVDAEYGINDLWLDVELKLIKGIEEKVDLSSSVINLGVGFDL